jgi:hypothetical protein
MEARAVLPAKIFARRLRIALNAIDCPDMLVFVSTYSPLPILTVVAGLVDGWLVGGGLREGRRDRKFQEQKSGGLRIRKSGPRVAERCGVIWRKWPVR